MNTRLLVGATVTAAFGIAGMFQTAQVAESRLPVAQMSPKNLEVGPVMKPGRGLAPMHLSCRARKAGEFPTSVVLTNNCVRPIPAGRRIHWVMKWDLKHPPARRQDNDTFKTVLPRGKSVGLAGVMSGAGPGDPCAVTFLKSGKFGLPTVQTNPNDVQLKPGIRPHLRRRHCTQVARHGVRQRNSPLPCS